MKLYKLNAQAIKKALKNYGIKVLRCRMGKGSMKSALSIVIKEEYSADTLAFFNEFGIVGGTGKAHKKAYASNGIAQFTCFMSEDMYNELNA